MRIWDRIDGVLVERIVDNDLSPSCTLGGAFVVGEHPSLGPMLRLSKDLQGKDLWPTPEEARELAEGRARVEAERARVESERAREEARLRERAEARVRELEEELKRRG